ncbi:hypothetical protein [Silvibacterium dinghuense]|uniref:Uncharacterized protein n=1 Tax=Silvibacterium dinghuense TaxID=1560006 RepID=A0A4Q1SFK3_9BACT|nr:hypothetical protein [Silvibacterium dinghuense]RXS95648.1 hypothetical protein ESZ00_13915 [Silvibacterium dinghuense]GGH14672.1 hypothetical protein GCM10011586_35250 [Silvibacterium dinghuense]
MSFWNVTGAETASGMAVVGDGMRVESLLELEERAIRALTYVDRPVLEQLLEEASALAATGQRTVPSRELMQAHRIFGALLEKTARNLRLLRRAHHVRLERA